jgi:hypothetical protein
MGTPLSTILRLREVIVLDQGHIRPCPVRTLYSRMAGWILMKCGTDVMLFEANPKSKANDKI